MLIGVISDTHDRLPLIDRALAVLRERGAEVMIHPGDIVAPFAAQRLRRWPGTLYITYGNNDGERSGLKQVLPEHCFSQFLCSTVGVSFVVHHRGRRIVSEIVFERPYSQADCVKLRFLLRFPDHSFDLGYGREQKPHQDGDYGNHRQDFHNRKCLISRLHFFAL